jgi:chemotaxis protein CheC
MKGTVQLNDLQIDALKEVANIGAGHAATSLSELLGTTIRLLAPRADVIRFQDLHSRVADDGSFAILHVAVTGHVAGHLIVLCNQRDAIEFVALCLKKGTGDLDIHDALVEQTLKKMSDLVAASYLNAIAELAGVRLVRSQSVFSYGSARTTFEAVMPLSQQDKVFFVESTFIERMAKVSAHLVFVPERGSIEPLLATFGL